MKVGNDLPLKVLALLCLVVAAFNMWSGESGDRSLTQSSPISSRRALQTADPCSYHVHGKNKMGCEGITGTTCEVVPSSFQYFETITEQLNQTHACLCTEPGFTNKPGCFNCGCDEIESECSANTDCPVNAFCNGASGGKARCLCATGFLNVATDGGLDCSVATFEFEVDSINTTLTVPANESASDIAAATAEAIRTSYVATARNVSSAVTDVRVEPIIDSSTRRSLQGGATVFRISYRVFISYTVEEVLNEDGSPALDENGEPVYQTTIVRESQFIFEVFREEAASEDTADLVRTTYFRFSVTRESTDVVAGKVDKPTLNNGFDIEIVIPDPTPSPLPATPAPVPAEPSRRRLALGAGQEMLHGDLATPNDELNVVEPMKVNKQVGKLPDRLVHVASQGFPTQLAFGLMEAEKGDIEVLHYDKYALQEKVVEVSKMLEASGLTGLQEYFSSQSFERQMELWALATLWSEGGVIVDVTFQVTASLEHWASMTEPEQEVATCYSEDESAFTKSFIAAKKGSNVLLTAIRSMMLHKLGLTEALKVHQEEQLVRVACKMDADDNGNARLRSFHHHDNGVEGDATVFAKRSSATKAS